jgi:hypothetical protein
MKRYFPFYRKHMQRQRNYVANLITTIKHLLRVYTESCAELVSALFQYTLHRSEIY